VSWWTFDGEVPKVKEVTLFVVFLSEFFFTLKDLIFCFFSFEFLSFFSHYISFRNVFITFWIQSG